MRTLKTLIQKEFRQIFRNKTMLPIIFIVPLVQMLVLVFAATFELKNIDFYVFDEDNTPTSRAIIHKYSGSPFYTLKGRVYSQQGINDLLANEEAHMVMRIPSGFEQGLLKSTPQKVFFAVNAVNATVATLVQGYSFSIVQSFTKELGHEWQNHLAMAQQPVIDVIPRYWYNSQLNYKYYMLPGILVILVTLVGTFLSAMNLVREKELGTLEQMNVTPVKKHHFIIGKLIPFWCIALFELAFGLLLGKIIFDIPMVGSIPLLFLFAGIYLILALGIGLFLSTMSNTQQQVMFLAWFIILVFMLMSGLFTPVESMPEWAQKLNYINPFAYFIKIIRMILLKGSGFFDILQDMVIVLLYGLMMISLAVWRYRKTA